MKKIISLCCMLLTACGSVDDKQQVVTELPDTFDPRLHDLIMEYLADCQRHLTSTECNKNLQIKIRIRELEEENQLGLCYTYYPPYHLKRDILISPKLLGTKQLKLVLYHELTHCIFEMEHSDDKIDIMNSYSSEYKTNIIYGEWDKYLEAMFSRTRQ